MAEAVPIPSDMLQSGDLVDVEYEIKAGAPEALVNLAISQVKKDLWADPRFDYQSSRRLYGYDADQVWYDKLIVTVSVRQYPRGQRPEVQQAGIFVPIAVLIALLAGVVASYGLKFMTARVTLRATEAVTSEVERIRNDPNMTEAEKQAAYAALQQRDSRSIGSGLAAAGGSILTAAIIIAVLWALSLSRPARGGFD